MITDVRGREHTFTAPPRRVVSLVPSLTETLFDLGAGDCVVGITDFCIFPPDLDLPRLGGTKNPKIDRIRALTPDLVHMNLEENLERHAREIETFAPVFVTEPKSVDDVATMIVTLGELHSRVAPADELVHALQHERAALPQRRFTFACPIWKKPWMWCGGDTYVSRLVEAAGGVNVVAELTRYPALELDTVLARRPDIIFLPDEPYVFTLDDAEELRSFTRVIGPFEGHLFTWHGTRTRLGLRFLQETL
jgi:iron complex transport system substrate-binding protein